MICRALTRATKCIGTKLEAFDRKTSTQIAVVAVDDLDGYAPGTMRSAFMTMGIGRKGKDNGILIWSSLRGRFERQCSFRRIRSGVVRSRHYRRRIIDTEMLPGIRSGDYYAGIDRAATVLIKLTEGEFTADAYGKQGDPAGLTGGLILFIVFIVLPCFRAAAG